MTWDVEELLEVAPSIFDVRATLGFEPVRWETLPVRLMCVVRELEELAEALEERDTDAVAIELSDVAMYLLTIVLDLWPGTFGRRHVGHHNIPSPHQVPESLTGPTRRHVANAFESWRRRSSKDTGIFVELALLETMRMARALDIELPAAIGTKIMILRRRDRLNGGKHPAS